MAALALSPIRALEATCGPGDGCVAGGLRPTPPCGDSGPGAGCADGECRWAFGATGPAGDAVPCEGGMMAGRAVGRLAACGLVAP